MLILAHFTPLEKEKADTDWYRPVLGHVVPLLHELKAILPKAIKAFAHSRKQLVKLLG